jgi:isoquinoline 1-oxidoreductase subunit beta
VSNIPHGFAVQSMAANSRQRPEEMLLELLGPPRVLDARKFGGVHDFWNYGDPVETYPNDVGRLRTVVELVAEKSDGGKRNLPHRRGMGIAIHRSFLTYVATVVEAAVDEKGMVTLPHVWTARTAQVAGRGCRCDGLCARDVR